MNFTIISALDQNRGIGQNIRLPWNLPKDLQHFAKTTKGNTVIMGRKTWDSLPVPFRPLKGRLNIVISRGEVELPEGVLLAHSLDEALEIAEKNDQNEDGSKRKTFVIGGATLYAEAIRHPNCEELILTELDGIYHDCDAFFPEFKKNWTLMKESELNEEGGIQFQFKTYRK